jgi:hypothetical protein
MAERYWVGGGSSTNWNATGSTNWSATSGGANNASVPGSSDTVFFDENSGAGESKISANVTVISLDCTGFTGTLSHGSGVTLGVSGALIGTTTYGIRNVLTFSEEMTYSPAVNSIINPLVNNGVVSTNTITTAGKVLGSIKIGSTSKTFILTEDIELSGIFELTNKFFDQNGFKIKAANIKSNGTNSRFWATSLTGNIAYSATEYDIFGGDLTEGETEQTLAQSFTAQSTSVRAVILSLKKTGTLTDNIIVSIVSSLNESSTNTSTLTASDVTTGGTVFVFDEPVSTIEGNTYYIKIKRSGDRDESNYISWYYTNADSYLDGSLFVRANNIWSEDGAKDFAFYTVNGGVTGEVELTGDYDVMSIGGSASNHFFEDMVIRVTGNSDNEKTIIGDDESYDELIDETQGGGELIITGDNTFNAIRIDSGRVVNFTEGSTQTIYTLEADGATLQSTTVGSQFTLYKPNTNEVSVREAIIQDSNATGNAKYLARKSVDGGNNSGWDFVFAVTNLPTTPTSVTNITI